MILQDHKDWFLFKMPLALQRHFETLGIYFSMVPGHMNFQDGAPIEAPKGPYVEPFIVSTWRIQKIGYCSYVGTDLSPLVEVGRYCSIAMNVKVMAASHPLDRITTSAITYGVHQNPYALQTESLGGQTFAGHIVAQKHLPILKNDVWVGQDVILGRGITLHDGSVAAAGAVVTKDVPPYAVVGGNPARVLKYRFDEKTIERLLEIKFWQYAAPHFAHLPTSDVPAFLDGLERMVEEGAVEPYTPEKFDIYQIVNNWMAAHQ